MLPKNLYKIRHYPEKVVQRGEGQTISGQHPTVPVYYFKILVLCRFFVGSKYLNHGKNLRIKFIAQRTNQIEPKFATLLLTPTKYLLIQQFLVNISTHMLQTSELKMSHIIEALEFVWFHKDFKAITTYNNKIEAYWLGLSIGSGKLEARMFDPKLFGQSFI